jgi:CubicO group peptidase (beta-lactamase class C family)
MLDIMLFPYINAVFMRLGRLQSSAWIFAFWSFIVLAIPDSQASAESVDVSSTKVAALRHTLQEIKRRHNIPCLSLSWIKDHPAQLESVTLNCATDAVLRWGSISKTFTALTVLALAEDGLVDLNAPISAYLDASLWDNAWADDQPIRVIDLIELRAGFADLSGRAFYFNVPMELAKALAFERNQLRTLWPPGLQHAYSNLTPGLSQLLIEHVSGQSYAETVQQQLFEPLQFTSASFVQNHNLLPGFQADGTTPIPYWQMTFAAFGALNAPTADMQKLLVELLQPAALSNLQHRHLRQPHGRRFLPEFTFDYAAGFYPRIRRGFTWHNHGGDADGYRSRLSIMAEHQRGYLANITSDNPGALREIEQAIEGFLTADLPGTDKPPEFNLSDAQHNALTGTYYPSSTRFGVAAWQSGKSQKVTIVRRDGQLWLSTPRKDTRLFAVERNQFRRAEDPVATVAFVQVGEHLYLQGELGHYVRSKNCPTFLHC